jgi:hypothetical protein
MAETPNASLTGRTFPETPVRSDLKVNAICALYRDMGAQLVEREARKPLQPFLYHDFGQQSKTSGRHG